MSKLQKKSSALKRGHPTLQNRNFYKIFFLLLWVIFALLDPDPDSESGSGSTGPIEFGSNPDPDPKPCFKGYGPVMWYRYLSVDYVLPFST
jgi:hypothetical protein